MGYDFIFNDVQDRLDPFDNETFDASPIEMYAVATDMLFGTATYLPVKSAVLDLDAVRASTSLPLVTPPVEIDGHKYVDGGVADSVPIEHVLEEAGFERAVVIVTQDRSYEKKPYEFMPAARARYADYPYLLEAIETRHDRYNIQRMHLWKYEREGRALVVAPQKPVEVGHVEHDPAKLWTCISRAVRRQSACSRKSKSSLSASDGEPSKMTTAKELEKSRLVDDMCRNSGRSQNTC